MDRVIEKQPRPWWPWVLAAVTLAAAVWGIVTLLQDASIRTLRVSADELIISDVSSGTLEDLTPIRGSVQPLNTVFLDAVDGGVVEEILVEEGSYVEIGQPLLQLSNNTLQLQVANNDTQTTEQLNNLKNISNNLETTRLQTERQLIDIRFRIKELERNYAQLTPLLEKNLVSRSEYETVRDELEYQRKVYANTQERQELEEKIRVERLTQIEGQMSKLEENLELAKNTFENLLVRAPVSGQLTSLPIQIGENMNRGERLGQIDSVDQYKIVAQVDEFYVSRVSPGQTARFTLSNRERAAEVTKVYPEITQGSFTIDLEFSGPMPENIRRGQTLQLELTLGQSIETLLIPVGGFIQDTGGNWVFVVNNDGSQAHRRDITSGRRNNRFLEVQSGLEAGNRVITSNYSQFLNYERLDLND
ncbi:efflux RND transporter periplasmic adaptor subunit [Pseudohongiella nitratireducens]|uniref:efflux RND transporter periplasmic adaptor subunit n=1 Tax=Pseudohongiella nitratireducens TaxID=1768907 RepID=UPI0030ED9CD8|tara:strand:+ start:2807 stop:4060 length:1254 start_codon:yes stop_codon:yes gene_type:complete